MQQGEDEVDDEVVHSAAFAVGLSKPKQRNETKRLNSLHCAKLRMYPKVECKTVRILTADGIQDDVVTSSLLIMNGYNIQREFRVFLSYQNCRGSKQKTIAVCLDFFSYKSNGFSSDFVCTLDYQILDAFAAKQ